MGAVRPFPANAVPHLQEGISLLLSRWSALSLAVENEWGGRKSAEKARKLAADIFSWFTKPEGPLYIEDLEDNLDNAMVSYFNSDVEDGSIEEVAEKLMIMHEECLEGNYVSVVKLREENAPRNLGPHIGQGMDDENGHDSDDGDDNDDDDDESMEEYNDSSNILVDGLQQVQVSNTVKMQPTEPRSAVPSVEAEDEWVVVTSRKNKGKRS